MPIGFSRIKLAGFKSFAEPATVEVHPGLTGIVGPNGCGKSNVVEALRWAMGESSARSLRGGEMDDVIFAGTTHRPARNLAEVVLTLESADTKFPAPFDGQSELEVSRRIERGAGSAYRVNGREARARDVQTLFADLASGARASAMVSQGRVGALVAARPDERRAILEEAAGISGLHSRRHEAELKLRAAEANAERAEDLRTQLSAQLAALQKQARQANRYRNLSGLIRAAEAELLALLRARTEAARAAARARLATITEQIARATAAAAAAAQQAATATDSLPPLRAAEAEARTLLERARIAREHSEAEQQQAAAALAAARAAVAQITADRAHAAQLQRDADTAEQALAQEATSLAAEAERHPALAATAAQALAQAAAALAEADALTHQATTASAELAASGRALAEARNLADSRARKAQAALHAVQRDYDAIQLIAPALLESAQTEAEARQTAAAEAATALAQAETLRSSAAAAHQTARAQLHDAEKLHARLGAEHQALAEILGVQATGADRRLIDLLRVPEGLEAAIGAALGETLDLPTNPEAPRHMRALPPLDPAPPLPAGAIPLTTLIEAPPELARALSQIGLIETNAAAIQPNLTAGQMLVSRDGAVWRWDGLVQHAGAPTQATVRLQQRNRLADLATKLAAATTAWNTATQANTQAATAERDAIAAESARRAARSAAEQAAERARTTARDLQHRAESAATSRTALHTQLLRLTAEHDTAEAEHAAATKAHDALPDLAAARTAMDQARQSLTAARAAEQTARAAIDALHRQATGREFRLRAILVERAGWSDRARAATTRAADLTTRQTQAEAAESALATRPDALAQAQTEAAAALAAAEQNHRACAQRLQHAETATTAATRADRDADSALAAARESALRCESDCRDADHAWGSVAERILERLGVNPELPTPTDLSPEAEDRARRKHERLTREREEMGPVNLRAELESAEIETRLAGIDTERAELTAAIHKLRGSIGHLNREGRERLNQVFTEVDRHFQQLFARMFGGGRAHLALVGSDDPLLAGLEIYAQPPGKKLATLSLLSGGEQALTALSLIFAVFRCNPAPVCVLDEVDAPLDDANIDRFCTLLADMVAETGTRFLVVTHHHMTMARMDRLYGVTMQERGVSRLLSVDLQRASEMVETVAIAAE
jgi:chromosome segregation protein